MTGVIVLAVAAIAAAIFLFVQYSNIKKQHDALRGQLENRARAMFDGWRASTLPQEAQAQAVLMFNTWRADQESTIRGDAIKRSQSVIIGKVTEHLLPFFPEFPYDPRDARFLGTPIDLVVFDGLSESNVRKIVFMEVKTGKGSLTTKERSIRKCIENQAIEYEVRRLPIAVETAEELVEEATTHEESSALPAAPLPPLVPTRPPKKNNDRLRFRL
ncbi:MAG: Holliday junction resolvase-like protein [Actinomycetota bacterium]